jgi:DNA invertase Pin-like site-specific DNA recombinase
MKREQPKTSLRCAIYTRVSTDSGLEQDFNSLDNQREASEAYIKSQAHEGWSSAVAGPWRSPATDSRCSGYTSGR